jgi:hypothetical protein
VTWTVYDIGDFIYFNGIKARSTSGFIAECTVYDVLVPYTISFILHVIAIHD